MDDNPSTFAGACHAGQPRRSPTSLSILLFTLLAFTLGGIVSLWFFNRSSMAAPMPRLSDEAAVAVTDNAAHLVAPATPDSGDSKSAAANVAGPQAGEAAQATGATNKRPATMDARTLAGAAGSGVGTVARQSGSIKSELVAAPARLQAERRERTFQPAPEGRNAGGGGCTLVTSKNRLTLGGKGSTGEVAVSLGGATGPAAITASTADWSNIVVFASARRGGVSVYRVVSVSQRPGTYGVTFRSPCGAKHIAVTVE